MAINGSSFWYYRNKAINGVSISCTKFGKINDKISFGLRNGLPLGDALTKKSTAITRTNYLQGRWSRNMDGETMISLKDSLSAINALYFEDSLWVVLHHFDRGI